MLELVIGKVDRRGRADMAIDGHNGIQTKIPKRNAVCKTADGRKFHIRDYTWHWVGAAGCKVPRFKSRQDKFIKHFPVKDDHVYALVDFSIKGKRGRNPDAQAWAPSEYYERGVKRVLGFHDLMSLGKQDQGVTIVREMVDAGPARSPDCYDKELMRLDHFVLGRKTTRFPSYMVNIALSSHDVITNFFRHYALGVPAEEINDPLNDMALAA